MSRKFKIILMMTIPNAGEDVQKLGHSHTASRDVKNKLAMSHTLNVQLPQGLQLHSRVFIPERGGLRAHT